MMGSPDKSSLGAYLKEARLISGLEQTDVSEAMKYSTSQHVSNVECDKSIPGPDLLKKMAELYKLNYQELAQLVMIKIIAKEKQKVRKKYGIKA